MVSRLFEDPWIMLLTIGKFIETSRGNFKVRYLTRRAREKYGKEIITNISQPNEG